MKKITIILTAFILICPLQAVAGPKTQDRKTRRQLEKAYPRYARMPVQNELLRELKAAER